MTAPTSPAHALVHAFHAYLTRTLEEAGAGTAQLLGSRRDIPSKRATVAVCVGRRPGAWYRAAGWGTGLRVGFTGHAGTGPGALEIAVLDRWDPERLGPTPSGFDVLAVIATFNERDVIDGVLSTLREDTVRVHVVDNWSTDETFDLVSRRAAQDPGVTVERFPADGPSGAFELERILERVEDLCHASGADWVVNHDADEVRQSPWPGVSLRRGLYAVEEFGFDCVDHTVMNFRPVDERWDGTGRLADAFTWFEFGDVAAHFVQKKAWKPQPEPVRFAATGGHDAAFPGRRVFPYKFLLRHYPIRSSAHGRRKILHERQGRFSAEERKKGWHVHYDDYSERSDFLWDAAGLHRFTTLADLDDRLLVERLSGAGLPGNPVPAETLQPDQTRSIGKLAK